MGGRDGVERQRRRRWAAAACELAAPTWQQSASDWASVGCGEHRAVADISADADPYTGVAIYDSTAECEYEEGGKSPGPWCTIGGTSLASPLIASVFALAGGSNGVEYPAQTLYENLAASPNSLHDVDTGIQRGMPKTFRTKKPASPAARTPKRRPAAARKPSSSAWRGPATTAPAVSAPRTGSSLSSPSPKKPKGSSKKRPKASKNRRGKKK